MTKRDLAAIASIIRRLRSHTESYPKGSIFVFLEDAICAYCIESDDSDESFNRNAFIRACGGQV